MTTTLDDHTRQRALILSSVIAGFLFVGIFDANVALPSIATSLDIGPVALQLISAGYVVTFGLTLVPFGRLGDRGHRKQLILIGLILYIASSILCGIALNWWALIAGRVLLGVGAGMLMPQAIGVIQQLFTGAERGKAFGTYGVTVAVSTALGPPIGGLILGLGGPIDSWRWIFLMNVPIALGLLVSAVRILPPDEAVSEQRKGFDPFGNVLLGIAVVLVLFPLIFTTGEPDDDPRRWWALVPAVAFGAAFVWWEKQYSARGRSPLVDLDLLKTPSFSFAMVVGMIAVGWSPGVMIVLTLYLQEGLHLTPMLAALVALPSAAGSAYGAWWAAQRVLTLGRIVTIAGFVISGVAILGILLAAVYLPVTVSPFVIAGLQVVNGLGGGMVLSPNHVLLLSDVPQEKGSLAASIGHLAQRIGNSVGIAATGAAFYAIVYGINGALGGASKSTYDEALRDALVVSAALLAVGIGVAFADMLRMRRIHRENPTITVPTNETVDVQLEQIH